MYKILYIYAYTYKRKNEIVSQYRYIACECNYLANHYICQINTWLVFTGLITFTLTYIYRHVGYTGAGSALSNNATLVQLQ